MGSEGLAAVRAHDYPEARLSWMANTLGVVIGRCRSREDSFSFLLSFLF